MTKYEQMYHDIAASIPGARESKMFGALCIKADNGKAGVLFWKDDMVFKLPPEEQEKALKLRGAIVFEPSEGKQMNGWIHVPRQHSNLWPQLAQISMRMVGDLKK